ncbi:MAG: 30S ribosomal protein S5 [bacterium]
MAFSQNNSRGGKGGGGRREGGRDERPKEEFDQKILELARVTRVTAGGKRMRFRTCLVIGDRKGRVGYAVAKGLDVQLAIQKAFTKAKKNVIQVPIVDETIPHEVTMKFGSAVLMLKPASRGNGIKAGGPLRVVLELAGVPNVTGKMLGASNKINNVRAAFLAIKYLERYSKKAQERVDHKKAKELEAKKLPVTV